MQHVDYPHDPGHLYDCAACESDCHCAPDSALCVHCTIEHEHFTIAFPGSEWDA